MNITPGPELDRAVAEAIGWTAKESAPWEGWDIPPKIRIVAVDETGAIHWVTTGGPSTDLNAAFMAAEKLCGCGFALHTAGKAVGGWQIFRCIVTTRFWRGRGTRGPGAGFAEQALKCQ